MSAGRGLPHESCVIPTGSGWGVCERGSGSAT